jgi:hypothetical protein
MELQEHHTAATSQASALTATYLHGKLTHKTTSPSNAPKRGRDITAAAQSMDFGFSPESLKWGWGEGTSMAPQEKREAPKGHHRHRGRTCRPRVSLDPKRTPPTHLSPKLAKPVARSSKEERTREMEGGLQNWRRGPMTPPSHHDKSPLTPRHPRDQDHRTTPTNITS